MKTVAKLMGWTLVLTCASALAQDRPPDSTKTPPAAQGQASPKADNTDINERDKGGATKTPEDQANLEQDRKLLAAVRRAVVRDKSLSTMAHNAKIMVESGVVTLRGPVKNDAEKTKVESRVKRVKGVTTIDNQLDVKTQ